VFHYTLSQLVQVPVGEAHEQTLTIKNLTKRPITWVISSVKGASIQQSHAGAVKRVSYPAFSPRRQSGTLAGHEEAQVTVTFVAREPGTVSQFWMVRSTHSQASLGGMAIARASQMLLQSAHMEMKTSIEMLGRGVEPTHSSPLTPSSPRKPLRALPSSLQFDDVMIGNTLSMHIKVR
jgi:hypothetical protein